MNDKWYNEMQRLGSITGYGMRFVIRLHRSTKSHKMRGRTKTCLGDPQPLVEGSDLFIRPVLIKRTGKIIEYRVERKEPTE